jgi:hypothetical protein
MPRRWDVRLGIVLLVVAASVVIGLSVPANGTVGLEKSLPRPTTTDTQKVPTSTPAPTSSSASTPAPTAAPVDIPPGLPTKIFVADAGLSTSITKMPTSCQNIIDPPRSGVAMTEVFGCSDFALPGTNSSSLSVLTGHSSPYQATQLNKLNDQQVKGTLVAGEKIMIQTATSGEKWLVYAITGVYEIPKPELPYDTRVWGNPGESTSNRLVIVTCRVANVVPAPKNLVVVGQLEGVSN